MANEVLCIESLKLAIDVLSGRDEVMKRLLNTYGYPPLWRRPQTFKTLLHIVLEQKVSLASAAAVMKRVAVLCPSGSADYFLQVPVKQLRDAGISERKVEYCRAIATAITTGQLKLASLRYMDDASVMENLEQIKGVGPWTAGVYLLMAMRRCDAWATGDRALAVSAMECFELADVPSYDELDQMALRWSPHRAAASRMLWHAYLSRRAA